LYEIQRDAERCRPSLAQCCGFIATVPPLIVHAIFQRQIIQGMATAGLAGR
jgi:ABC-type glycerol-3-phosphate transport system permease component